MKIISAILCILFLLTLVVPAVEAFVNPEEVSLFIVDEENNNVKEDQTKKFKSIFPAYNFALLFVATPKSNHITTNERLFVSPYLGIYTPPPNCC